MGYYADSIGRYKFRTYKDGPSLMSKPKRKKKKKDDEFFDDETLIGSETIVENEFEISQIIPPIIPEKKEPWNHEPLIPNARPCPIDDQTSEYIMYQMNLVNNFPENVVLIPRVNFVFYTKISWIPVLQIDCVPNDILLPRTGEFEWFDEKLSAIVFHHKSGNDIKINLVCVKA